MMKTLATVSLFASFAACTDDAVSYSDAVGIELKAKSSDVVGGVIVDEKQITTESGNPFGAFVADARRTLNANPGAIEVEQVELSLGAGSVGVATLGDVFAGEIEVLFQVNDTDNTYIVASGTAMPAVTGPLELSVDFLHETVDLADYEKMLNGSFKVVTRGAAAPGFSGKGATAELQVTFTFAAFE
jgi:hypothetical protein